MDFFASDSRVIPYVWAAGLWLVVGSLLVLIPIRKEHRLARYGEAAVASVADSFEDGGREPRVFGQWSDPAMGKPFVGFRADYVFRTRDGREARGAVRMTPDRITSGRTIDVLYDPSRPDRNVATVAMKFWEF
jgi:hypothetical protein